MISGGGGDAGGDADGDAECDVSPSRLVLLFWLLLLPLVACACVDTRVVVLSLLIGCLIALDLGLLASTYMSVASVSSLMLASSCCGSGCFAVVVHVAVVSVLMLMLSSLLFVGCTA